MRVEIRAIGRLKSSPEGLLVKDYIQKTNRLAPQLGFSCIFEKEIDNRSLKSKTAETKALIAGLDSKDAVFALDKSGEMLCSNAFTEQISRTHLRGQGRLVFLIGGPNGHDHSLLASNIKLLSFGSAIWPHKLVRVMLVEQIYRSYSFLAGMPYHREG